jgi:hypothetical protein
VKRIYSAAAAARGASSFENKLLSTPPSVHYCLGDAFDAAAALNYDVHSYLLVQTSEHKTFA